MIEEKIESCTVVDSVSRLHPAVKRTSWRDSTNATLQFLRMV